MSTNTEPCFIVFSIVRVMSFGAEAPGTSTAPITRSALVTRSAIAARVFLTDRGVEKHVTSIFQKLQLPVAADTHRRVLAVIAFLRS